MFYDASVWGARHDLLFQVVLINITLKVCIDNIVHSVTVTYYTYKVDMLAW